MAQHPSERKTGFPILPLLFLAVALAAGVIWWLRRPTTPTGPNTVATPVPTKTPQSKRPTAMSYTLYVPNDQALLSKRVVTEKNPFRTTPTWTLKAGRTLELLFKRLTILPRNTKVLNSPKRDAHGVVTVNVSQEFMTLDSAHETTAALVLDSIAKTLESVEPSDGKRTKVRILVEGKPIKTLSEFDLSEPWTSTQPADEMPPDAESVQ